MYVDLLFTKYPCKLNPGLNRFSLVKSNLDIILENKKISWSDFNIWVCEKYTRNHVHRMTVREPESVKVSEVPS